MKVTNGQRHKSIFFAIIAAFLQKNHVQHIFSPLYVTQKYNFYNLIPSSFLLILHNGKDRVLL